MTLLELVTELRNMLEDTGGTGVDWELDASERLLKWTNSELTLLINEAEKEVAVRTRCLFDALTAEVCTISITATNSNYTQHSSIIEIRQAQLNSNSASLRHLSWKDLEALDSKWEAATGTPVAFLTDYSFNKIKLYPVPTETDTLKLNVYRYPVDEMTWAQRASSEPEVPLHFHKKMLSWAAHLAYMKDEPNTEDTSKSVEYEQKFSREIGPGESAYTQVRKKRPKRGISYGGI